MSRAVVVHRDAEALATTTAARLLTHLVDAQSARGTAHVVLTGGTIGVAVLEQVAVAPARDAVDWGAVHVWWGDERFLPAGDPDRNETQARAALLDHVPLDPATVHAMPASDGPDGDDVDAAAARYAAELAAAGGQAVAPAFDVLLLGMGPDGHVASLFPGFDQVGEETRSVVGVRDSPKPPPTRISLTFPAIHRAHAVWVVVSGEGKADAAARALGGADRAETPAAGATGRDSTLWLLDRAAAGNLA